MLFCILLGGVLDGVGISAMLPVLSIAMRGSSDAPDSESADTSALGKTVDRALETIGLEPSLQVLLPFIVILFWIEGWHRPLRQTPGRLHGGQDRHRSEARDASDPDGRALEPLHTTANR